MDRIYHSWDKWECYRNNFFGNMPRGLSKSDGEKLYENFFHNTELFDKVCSKIIIEWKYSCEHNLTNEGLNRIAWMGQAAMAYHHNIPADCRGGYNLLNENEQIEADKIALKNINKWMVSNGFKEIQRD